MRLSLVILFALLIQLPNFMLPTKSKNEGLQEILTFCNRLGHIGYWRADIQRGTLCVSRNKAAILEMPMDFEGDFFEIKLDVFIESYVHQDDRERISKHIERLSEFHDKPDFFDEFEHRALMPNGKLKFIQVKCCYLKDGFHHGISQDVTEQKQIIEDLTTQIQSAEQFTYIISHNLRSPIARMLGLVETLGLATSSQWMDFSIQTLKREAEQLNQLTIDLNNILNIRKEKSDYNERVNLMEVIAQSIEFQHDLIAAHRVTVEVELLTENSLVLGVEAYYKSIFQNLISNAIKYRSPLRSPLIHIRVQDASPFLLVEFKDNGLGLDMEKNKGKVFGLYKRFHPEIPGRGVGLYITKTQIEMMGGKIEMESRVGEGTSFRLLLRALDEGQMI